MESVGCDVSKLRVDVWLVDGGVHFSVANEPGAIESLIRRLPKHCRVGMEATNCFHELLAEMLSAAGHQVFVINPRWIHNYARSLGMRGKTDRTDAEVIARFVQAEHAGLHQYRPPSPQQRQLRMLIQRRQATAKLLSTARQNLGQHGEAVISTLKSLSKELERAMEQLVRSHPDWADLYARLRKLPGCGLLTAVRLVWTLNTFGFTRADAFIAHTGTDPRPNDSGQKRGRRRISHHGDGTLRSLLYMAAMTSVRNPAWRPYYLAQQAKGLSTTAALIVVARRLARVAFSLYKTGQTYDPARVRLSAP